jgi:hypothetical protein
MDNFTSGQKVYQAEFISWYGSYNRQYPDSITLSEVLGFNSGVGGQGKHLESVI